MKKENAFLILSTDAEVVVAFQLGNVDAFEEISNRYSKKILLIINNIVHNKENAKDIAQDTFLTVILKLGHGEYKEEGDSKSEDNKETLLGKA